MSSSSSFNVCSSGEDRRKLCDCKQPLKLCYSWTYSNPARRFLNCPNSLGLGKKCNVFVWVDPELPNTWYKSTMFELHMKDKHSEKGEASVDRYSERMVKNLEEQLELSNKKRDEEVATLKMKLKEKKSTIVFYRYLVLGMVCCAIVYYSKI